MKKGFSRLCAAFLVCLLLFSGCGVGTEPLWEQVSVSHLEEKTRYLTETIGPRVSGTKSETDAERYLVAQLGALGFSQKEGTLLTQAFPLPTGGTSKNLTAVCNPEKSSRFLIAAAHYDSVENCPGARDNGASVAGLLEAARILAKESETLPIEVRLVFFGAEEGGYHGSTAYVAAMTAEEKERCMGVFNMDISAVTKGSEAILTCTTLGGRTDAGYQPGNVLEPMDNLVSREAVKAYEALYPGAPYRSPHHYGDSDHLPFHEAGIDAANLCWRVSNGDFAQLPEEYHQPNDVAETLDYNSLKITVQCVLKALDTLAREGALD